MDGVPGNESLTATIEAGQTLYFKVSSLYATGDVIPYTVRAGVL